MIRCDPPPPHISRARLLLCADQEKWVPKLQQFLKDSHGAAMLASEFIDYVNDGTNKQIVLTRQSMVLATRRWKDYFRFAPSPLIFWGLLTTAPDINIPYSCGECYPLWLIGIHIHMCVRAHTQFRG